MACLHPFSIVNPKYKDRLVVTPSPPQDYFLMVPCGKCNACLRSKSRQIRFRLNEEFKASKNAYFLTLTVSDDFMHLFEDNPKLVFRKWFEHLRYLCEETPRHWITSELGERTRRLHFHGLLFNCSLSSQQLAETWKYGFSYVGYVNDKSISYVSKYIVKPQLFKPGYTPFILSSNRPGIGYQFATPQNIKEVKENDGFVRDNNGKLLPLPRYYLNKFYSEDELKDRSYQRHLDILSDPDKFVRQLLLRSKSKSLTDYLAKREAKLANSQYLGLTPKNKLNTTILNQIYGTIKSEYDSYTTQRV